MKVLPDLKRFCHCYAQGKAQVLATRLVADLETPVSVMLKLAKGQSFACLLESVEGGDRRGRYSVIGIDPDLLFAIEDGRALINRTPDQGTHKFTAVDGEPFSVLREIVAESAPEMFEDLPPMTAGIFGYFGYDIVRQVERLPGGRPGFPKIPDALLIRPRIIAIFDALKNELVLSTVVRPQSAIGAKQAYTNALELLTKTEQKITADIAISDHGKSTGEALELGEITSNTSPEQYCQMVEKAKDYIVAGDIFQVALSQRFKCQFGLDPFYLYRALRRINPSPYLYYLAFDDFVITGSSPEIMVKATQGRVIIRPLAGTRKRGDNQDQDRLLEKELLSDSKELSEHLMLLDLGRNDVGKVAKVGSVKVDDQFFVERYSHVMHIVSQVSGRLAPNCDRIDALLAGFPAGTVSGAPKVRAMEIIDELEVDGRGPYAGCVGYFSANGDMDSCIILRTTLIKNGEMHVQAGAGIVADSIPEKEHSECIDKAMALFAAAKEAVRIANNAKR